jgi:hypothetical protein
LDLRLERSPLLLVKSMLAGSMATSSVPLLKEKFATKDLEREIKFKSSLTATRSETGRKTVSLWRLSPTLDK